MPYERATDADGGGHGSRLRKSDAVARALTEAIHAGDLDALRRLLAEHPGLAVARIQDGDNRESWTPLHVATDWPGHFPNGAAVVAALIEAGADPNAPVEGGRHAETPLHGAASSDDIEVCDGLLDAGADVEAPGASIAGGTPLDDAVGYGQWQVARRLVERGARVDKLWHAAALGMTWRVDQLLAASPPPTRDDVNDAFWQACHGGQRRTAEYLLVRGADRNWVPSWAAGRGRTTPLDIAGRLNTRRQSLVSWLRDQGAKPSKGPTDEPD